ncbi:MAG: 2-polyprenyl-3-methyl-6-methoxy-1,4-benzoquinone monooxygenase [Gammaproteobacteria bacterium]|nr:2-polyprenyl-3-methyl-6-methoxy-1,4-benzoquinone monooxygenase [Gammaproteobacteria bacterium]
MSHFSWVDRLLTEVDTGLRSIFPPQARATLRPSPGKDVKNKTLSPTETRHAIGLMRVNHSGEVCAQALYQGQALTAGSSATQTKLKQAALEEIDHLGWCEERLSALGGKVSVLNPFWYMGSIMLGAGAGLLGDKVSLGFVVEVERQVEAHLAHHLGLLPRADKASRAVLLQMQEDESNHANMAQHAGGMAFPAGIKRVMSWVSTIMTKSSYYV